MDNVEDYLMSYREFFEHFAATVNPEDQLPVNIGGYNITEAELTGEVLYWTTQYLNEKQCPLTLMTHLQRIILNEVKTSAEKHPKEFGYQREEVGVYIELRLMQAVTAKVNEVCLRYLDNACLDTLPPPSTEKNFITVSSATKNARRAMEDRHVEIGNLEKLFGIETTEPTSFYAVYDGHAGSAAATYCAAHLHQYLVESPHFTTDLKQALRDAFVYTDAKFLKKTNQRQQHTSGGSTAVVVCIRGSQLHAAWAGDSQALLAKNLRLMQLVTPHKPSREDERERIEAGGGTVILWGTWRVNGQLAVSRAIGDALYKPYVTASPDLTTVELDGEEDFVVVACDGLWDHLSEDQVTLTVYRQLATDPNDLKAVAKQLIKNAKKQGSVDNISVIVVFLKDPHRIAAENCPPMELGLENGVASAPPAFALDVDDSKHASSAAGGAAVPADDNGVDHSDSDSEDLGPETAVDVDDVDDSRHSEPAAPTPPVPGGEAHVDGALLDNVAESGDDSEDEWNYYKGEGEPEREEQVVSEEAPRSETPCQDNSAWESSSVDMNSSPLNPDAPVFIPGGDMLLAESPRKPLPMDDIVLPDAAQFQNEAEIRPADLLNLDNCDQLNGHHTASPIEPTTEQVNGNSGTMEGLGFNVDMDLEKSKATSILQDLERIQKDTTDFCDIQVFHVHNETNPLTADIDEELFERLKNKESDPMSMSFYQEKDDDTCEPLGTNASQIDLNAVQTLPDSDEDDTPNGVSENLDVDEKENLNPEIHTLLDREKQIDEPNNDITRFDELTNNIINLDQQDNLNRCSPSDSSNIFSNIDFENTNVLQETILQTNTPESHKLLFEQIPEIPDGKSSELGFAIEDLSHEGSEDDSPHKDDFESKIEDKPSTPKTDFEPLKVEHEIPNEASIVHNNNSLAQTQSNENEIGDYENVLNTYEIVDSNIIPVNFHNEINNEQDKMTDKVLSTEVGSHINNDLDFLQTEIPMKVETVMPTQSSLFSEELFNRDALIPGEVHMEKQLHESVKSYNESPFLGELLQPVLSPSPVDISYTEPKDGTLQEPVLPQEDSLNAVSPMQHIDKCFTPEIDDVKDFMFENINQQINEDPIQESIQLVDSLSGPTPDLVPDEHLTDYTKIPFNLPSEPITDIDHDIPQLKAQEICVSVTSEICKEAATDTFNTAIPSSPTATSCVSLLQDINNTEHIPTVTETPIAADIETPAISAGLAIAAAAVATVAASTKDKTPTTKKVPITSKTPAAKMTPKANTTPRTPTSAIKKTTTTPLKPTTLTSKTTPVAKTPTGSTKPTVPKTTTPTTAKPAPIKSAATKVPAPTKTAPVRTTVSSTTRLNSASAPKAPLSGPKAPSAPRAPLSAPKAPLSVPKAPLSAPKVPLSTLKAPATKVPPAASKVTSTAPKVAAMANTAVKLQQRAPRPTALSRPLTTKPAPIDKKPLSNGDAKPPVKRSTAAVAPAARTAPRPAPRATPVPVPSLTKSARPAPAPRTASRPLDKSGKELANRQAITKTGLSRTAANKVSSLSKNTEVKSVPKKNPNAVIKADSIISNGTAEPELSKAPPTPPADNTLLPDVIA